MLPSHSGSTVFKKIMIPAEKVMRGSLSDARKASGVALGSITSYPPCTKSGDHVFLLSLLIFCRRLVSWTLELAVKRVTGTYS